MGDRGNIVLKDSEPSGMFPHPVYLYTHWSGYRMRETLQAALIRGKDRWNDPQYLSRVIFCQMIAAQGHESALTEITGFGITTSIGDNGRNLLLVHMDTQEVKELAKGDDLNNAVQRKWTFDEFVKEQLFADH